LIDVVPSQKITAEVDLHNLTNPSEKMQIVVNVPPAQVGMGVKPVEGNGRLVDTLFGGQDAISVQQTMRGCLQEICGCEAQSEYRVYYGHIEQGQARAEHIPQAAHLLEESSCCVRFCCGSMRAFNMPLTMGAPLDKKTYGPKVVDYSKGWSFPLFFTIPLGDNGSVDCPCCCLLPGVRTIESDGTLLGRSQYVCNLCCLVPKYDVYNKAGEKQYHVAPETCCGGCCIACRCGGAGSKAIYVPFLIRDPASHEPVPSKIAGMNAQINKVWSGFKKECCSDADNFQVVFPATADNDTKANLLGANILIDFTFFETHK